MTISQVFQTAHRATKYFLKMAHKAGKVISYAQAFAKELKNQYRAYRACKSLENVKPTITVADVYRGVSENVKSFNL